tara:strand:- start:113 stop:646 length:534 start_codon:yes stop_codon:yes gene_type:complete
MRKKPNTVGGGSKTNLNGLSFEGRTDLLESLQNNPAFRVSGHEVYQKDKLIGEYFEKYGFYNLFLKKNNIDWKKINSKQYLPDSIFYNHSNQTIYVIEKKYQAGSGSVDEKLQTCNFKKKVYKELIEPIGLKTEYYYLLNDWFDQDVYRDVFEYIEEVGCKYFIDFIPLNELGLSDE